MSASDTERLKQFFGAYFHQDWTEEAPDPDGVIAGFVSDHPQEEELTRLAALVEAYAQNKTEIELKKDLVSQLGCYYLPEADGVGVQDWLLHVARQLRAAAAK